MVNLYLSLIKFSHTVFALPFAFIGFFLAYVTYHPNEVMYKFLLFLLAMIFARSTAMAFNRYIDRDIDANNPRTKDREIPAGKISEIAAKRFILMSGLAFVITTYFINRLCFFLSPIALFVILGYSYTKRFTWLCHFILGIGLALAPVGAYLTISGKFDLITIILGCSIFFWVGGFDIIYALQDASFDSSFHLKSIPSRFGINKALTISRVSHILSVLLLAVAIYLMKSQFPAIGLLSWIALLFFMLLLIRQHSLVSESNFSNLNQAFFESNGLASLLFGTLIIIDLFI